MMKQFLTYISLFITLSLTAQNIPNGDFENWETRDHQKLNGWYSPTKNVERTTDAKVGNYALKLNNTYSATGNGTKGYVRSIDYNNRDTLNGFAFSGDALSLVFWSKHDLAVGDTARAYVVFREEGSYKGKADFHFSGSTNGEFVKYNVPLEWSSSRTPDSVWVYLYSYIDNKVQGDGYVIFDDMHFENIGQRLPDFTNNDFEDWNNIGVEFPSDWRSTDLLVYDTYTSFLTDSATQRVTDEHPKFNNALLIKNYQSGENVRHGYCYVGTENNQTYRRSFPVEDSFAYIQGYYKYFPDGPDTARILYRTWSGTRTLSYKDNYISEPSSEWKFFSFPIDYYREEVPDSAVLVAWSSKLSEGGGIGTKLYLDNLKLVMEPTPLKLSVKEYTSQYNVYPNPAKDLLYINALKSISITEQNFSCWVMNAQAQMIELNVQGEGQQKKIDISQLSPSVYFLMIQEGDTYSKPLKFIKK